MRRFVEGLADPSPEPAGGAALALTTAMAAALVSLVARAEAARRTAPAEREMLADHRRAADTLRVRATPLVDGDVTAYGGVMRALSLPADTDTQKAYRRGALDAALAGATEVPLSVAEIALAVLALADELAFAERSPLSGDLAAARALARGAADGALATALVNLSALRDVEISAPLHERARAIEERLAAREDHAVRPAG